MVRRIYGGIKEGDTYRRRNNKEINELLEGEDKVRCIKSLRMRWIWHVVRMDPVKTPNSINRARMEGKRKPGRPRSR